MLIVAQSSQLHMKDVLSHPLGPLLWVLANSDGSPETKLARELENLASPAEKIPEPSATILME